MKIKLKKGFENSIYIEYMSNNNNIIKNRNVNNYKINDQTIYIDDIPIGLLRITRSNKISLFNDNNINYILLEIWLKNNENYNYLTEIINYIINKYKDIEILIISFNEKDIDKYKKLINKNKFKEIKNNDITYAILNNNLNNNDKLYYLKFKKNKLLKESIKLYDFREVFYDKENEFKLINMHKTKKTYILELSEKLFILPYIKNNDSIKIIVKKDSNIFNNDIILPISYKYRKDKLKLIDNKNGYLIKEILNNNNIKISDNDNEINYVEMGEYFQNDSLDLIPCKFFVIDVTEKIINKNELSDNDNLTIISINKALKKSKSLVLISMILYMIHNIFKKNILNNIIDKQQNIQDVDENDEKELDENFSANLSSYESTDNNGTYFKTSYPNNNDDIIIKNSLDIIRKNKKIQ